MTKNIDHFYVLVEKINFFSCEQSCALPIFSWVGCFSVIEVFFFLMNIFCMLMVFWMIGPQMVGWSSAILINFFLSPLAWALLTMNKYILMLTLPEPDGRRGPWGKCRLCWKLYNDHHESTIVEKRQCVQVPCGMSIVLISCRAGNNSTRNSRSQWRPMGFSRL